MVQNPPRHIHAAAAAAPRRRARRRSAKTTRHQTALRENAFRAGAIAAFANKRHTAKCDACRKRGRSGYHAKVKRQAIDSDSAEMPL